MNCMRLKLLFVCAHPAIDEAARTLLMLQVYIAYQRAIGLTEHPAMRAFLLDQTRS